MSKVKLETHERTVAVTLTKKEGQSYIVSTVYVHPMQHGGPYETMVFHADAKGEIVDWAELSCHRYASVSKARDGHRREVVAWGTVVSEAWGKASGATFTRHP